MRRALGPLLAALLVGAGAGAETVASEGIGRAPLGGAAGVAPRSVALEAALRDAVRKVAEGLAGPGSGPAAEAALGGDPGRYAPTYRTRSTREEPGASGRELVLTVEAQVDRTLVAAALRRAGLLPEVAAVAPDTGLQQIVIAPVPPWPALSALRRRFVELGARRAVLALVEPDRVVVEVEGRSADGLARAVVSDPPPGTHVEAAGEQDGLPRLRVESAGVPPSSAD